MRRCLFVVAALIAISATVEAQIATTGGVRGRIDPNAPKREVSGTVLNSVTGEPIARALVQMMGAQQRSGLTDSQGSFHFDGVPEGPARFLARKPGFFNPEELSRGPGGRPMLPITISGDMPAVVLKLTPEAIVTGAITADDGEPLEGVSLRFRRQIVVNGRRQWEDRQFTSTNEDGEFRAANLQPGTFYLVAEYSRPMARRAVAGPEMGYAPTYYPGVPDLASASPITVQAGQTTRVDLRLRAQPVYEIAGTVLGIPFGRPVHVELMTRAGEPMRVALRFNPSDGAFSGKIAAGTYAVHATSPDETGQALTGSTTVAVSGNVSNIRLVLQPSISIPVVVTTEFIRTQPIAPVGGVSANNSRGPAQYASVSITGIDNNRLNSYASMQGMTDTSTLALRNIEPGRYAVQISPHGAWYVQSATCGQTDLLREELAVSQGDARPLEIVLRDDGGSVSGSVMSNNAPANGFVLVLPERRSVVPPVQYANERSGFRINTLAPGDYLLFAFDSVDGLEYSNRAALGDYASRAARVSVSNNSSANVTLTLIKRAEP